MTTELLDAEHRRITRAKQVQPIKRIAIPRHDAIKGQLSAAFQAVIDGKAEAQEIPPDDWRSKFEANERMRRVQFLFSKSNAPRRQLELISPDRSGEWGRVESRMIKKLGSGFLIALIGVRGCGKTQLAVELMRLETKRLREARYVTALEFFLKLRASYRKNASASEAEVLDDYATPSLLVIDEIARRGETDFENNFLFGLIDRRYRDVSDTIIISNQERAEFCTSIGPSLSSRMQETGGIIECAWQSYRE